MPLPDLNKDIALDLASGLNTEAGNEGENLKTTINQDQRQDLQGSFESAKEDEENTATPGIEQYLEKEHQEDAKIPNIEQHLQKEVENDQGDAGKSKHSGIGVEQDNSKNKEEELVVDLAGRKGPENPKFDDSNNSPSEAEFASSSNHDSHSGSTSSAGTGITIRSTRLRAKGKGKGKYGATKENRIFLKRVAKLAAETAAKTAAKAIAEATLASNRDEKKKLIKFKDAVGRKFTFPFHLVKKWSGMEELIKQAFLHVETIGPHIQEGHYDLIGPHGEIILPQVWEYVVEPDWTVTMHMWPLPEPLKGAPQGVEVVDVGPGRLGATRRERAGRPAARRRERADQPPPPPPPPPPDLIMPLPGQSGSPEIILVEGNDPAAKKPLGRNRKK